MALIITPSKSLDILGLHDFTAGGKSAIIASITVGICLMNILLYFLYHRAYPQAMRAGTWICLRDLTWFFRIRPHPIKPGYYHYAIPLPFPFWLQCCGRERTFGYTGEVDEDGRPHGLGTWTDDARHGECLQGVWEHGLPIGPFRSAEYQTDYRFNNVRMAFATNRAEPIDAKTSWWRPTFNREPGLLWGVASLEQSVAGAWFRALPQPEVLKGPEVGRDARWCLEHLIALRPDTHAPSLVVSAAEGELHVSGHSFSADSDPSQVVIQLVPCGASSPAASPARPSPDLSSLATAAVGAGGGAGSGGGAEAGAAAAATVATWRTCPSLPRPTSSSRREACTLPPWPLVQKMRPSASTTAAPSGWASGMALGSRGGTAGGRRCSSARTSRTRPGSCGAGRCRATTHTLRAATATTITITAALRRTRRQAEEEEAAAAAAAVVMLVVVTAVAGRTACLSSRRYARSSRRQ